MLRLMQVHVFINMNFRIMLKWSILLKIPINFIQLLNQDFIWDHFTKFVASPFLKVQQLILLLGVMPLVNADELIFTYWMNAQEPFVIRSEQRLSGGIVKDIGDELSRRMSLTPKYLELPTKRIYSMIVSGKAHLTCLSNPKWEENPDAFGWSPVLFKGTDNFLVTVKNKSSIQSFDDLRGKRVGTYNGYIYNKN